jgi:hypothetical protein
MARKAAEPSSMMGRGILLSAVGIILRWQDRVMFYVLACGSILLTIAFSSHSFESLLGRLARASETATARRASRNTALGPFLSG